MGVQCLLHWGLRLENFCKSNHSCETEAMISSHQRGNGKSWCALSTVLTLCQIQDLPASFCTETRGPGWETFNVPNVLLFKEMSFLYSQIIPSSLLLSSHNGKRLFVHVVVSVHTSATNMKDLFDPVPLATENQHFFCFLKVFLFLFYHWTETEWVSFNCLCFGVIKKPLSWGNDSHANETTAKQGPSLSLFGQFS